MGWLWISCHFHGMNLTLVPPQFTPDAKALVRLGIPGAISAGVVQINILVDGIFASTLPTGAVSYLFYADRLNQLPLGVIGIAVSTALLPELSKHVKANNHSKASHTQNRALEFAMAITLPAAIGLIVLGGNLVALLFERGAFTNQDALSTGYTLSAFAVGLPAYVLVKILSTPFFARKDTMTPMIVAIASVVLNLILNYLFIGPFSYVGLALSTALSAWFNALTLGFFLFLKEWLIFDTRMKEVLPRLAISSLLMGVFCYGLQLIMPFPNDPLLRLGIVGFWIFSGLFTYIITARLLGVFCFRDLQTFLKNQSSS